MFLGGCGFSFHAEQWTAISYFNSIQFNATGVVVRDFGGVPCVYIFGCDLSAEMRSYLIVVRVGFTGKTLRAVVVGG